MIWNFKKNNGVAFSTLLLNIKNCDLKSKTFLFNSATTCVGEWGLFVFWPGEFVFMWGRCKQVDDGLVEPVEELCKEVETVRGFCYLGDRMNASSGYEAAMTARTGIR